MKSYESYKKTNIPWLEEIPGHWEFERITHLFTENKDINAGIQETNALQFKFGELIQKKKFKLDDELKKTISKYTLIKPFDIMINGLNLNYDFVTQRVGLVKQTGVITSAYIAIRPREHIKAEYFALLLKSLDDKKVFNGMGSGIRLTLDYSELKKIQLPVPPSSEQDQIVRFLDWKISKINKLIKAKKKQIALLNEQKQAMINKAVTRGLDDTLQMKDSGVEWIGEISKKFSLCTLRRLIKKIESGTSVNAINMPASSDQIGVLSTSCVYKYVFDDSKNKKVESFDLHRVSCNVKANTVIVSRMNTPELVGASGFVSNTYKNLYLPDRLWQVSFNSKILPEYAALLLASIRVRKWFSYIATGSSNTMKNLSQDQFFNTIIPLPEISQQKKILFWCKEKSKKIDIISDKFKYEIHLLTEYKTSLISAVVSGKVDVRDIVVPNFDVEDEFLEDETETFSDEIEASEVDE